jgi:hypothetical protein
VRRRAAVAAVGALAALATLAVTPRWGAAEAPARPLRVVAVPGLGAEALADLARRGAVGLVVPGAGPTTSGRAAVTAIATGRVRNSLRGEGRPARRLVRVETATRPPAGDGLVVVGVPSGGRQRNDRRYPVAVIAPGYRGLLTSRATRIPGLVAAGDVAPTALGRPGRLGSRPSDDPVVALARLDRRIRDNGRARPLAMALLAASVVLCAWRRPGAALPALLAALVANLALGLAGTSRLAAVGAVMATAALVAAVLPWGRWRGGMGPVGALVVAGYGAALALAPAAVALSPLGPTQNSRFYGLSNLLETALLVPVIAAAVAAVRAAGWAGLTGVAALSLPTFLVSGLGADGGGAAVLAVALPVAAVEARRLPRRLLLLAVPAVALVGVGLVHLDARAGGTSHLTRALGRGLAGELAGRVELSVARLASGWHVAALTAGAVVALAVLHRRTVRDVPQRTARAAPCAMAAAVAASLVVNDSPPEVAVLGVVGYLALAAWSGRQRAGGANSARATADHEPGAASRNRPGSLATRRVVPSGPGATHTRPSSTVQ